MFRLAVFAAVLSVALVAYAAVPADEVTSLPGWSGALPSKHYSGYFPVDKGFLHYWLIMSESNPTTDPVVLWLNGGPGSSSLIGLLTENGQFQLNDDSLSNDTSATPTLIYNPFNWSRNTSVLYLEAPKGVGFSYCPKAADCVNSDESTAADSYTFLVNFFKGFPELATNDFFITGESYAGIYIPMLVDQIDKNGGINFKGAAIGDGCWGNDVGTCAFGSGDSDKANVEFFYGHTMISETLYADIKANCGNFTKRDFKCNSLIKEMNDVVGNFYIYNVYDDCGNDQMSVRKALSKRSFALRGASASWLPHPQLGGGLNDYVCGAMNAMNNWLGRDDVQKALHVEGHQGNMDYHRTASDLRPLYKELVQKYRFLIYSGDVDACVPYYGSEEWTRELGFAVTKPWHAWNAGTIDKPASRQRAGYVIQYGVNQEEKLSNVTEAPKTFTFLTVVGAGHMVPQFKPVRAKAMYDRFIAGAGY